MDMNRVIKTSGNVQNCNHEWDFVITPGENKDPTRLYYINGLFIEKCLKCFASVETVEILKNI